MAKGGPQTAFWEKNTGLPYPFAWGVTVSRGTGGETTSLWKAQEVTIPQESTMFDNFGVENRGGWLPGFGVIQRESFLSRSIVINFFDVSAEGEDPEWDLFRPWAIEVADNGLVDQGVQNGEITCALYDNEGNSRREIQAFNAFPTKCEGFTVNYGSQPFTVKSITFACRNIKSAKSAAGSLM